MIYKLSLKNTRLQDVVDAIDAGAGPGAIQIWTTSFVLQLLNRPLQKPCGRVTDGVLNFLLAAQTNALETGVPGVARIVDSNGVAIIDQMSVSLSGGGGDVIMSSLSLTQGVPVPIAPVFIVHGN